MVDVVRHGNMLLSSCEALARRTRQKLAQLALPAVVHASSCLHPLVIA